MSRNFTKEQTDAIEKEGTNIIVSAGAGSGKTAVLTERVIRKLKDGININQLIVLTFTKAAAYEMKERIRRKLKNDSSLKDQLSLLDASYITTFDSFALSIVKKYNYILNISPNVSISDSRILDMEESTIIDNIFDELYKEKNSKFLKLIGDLCVKDDTNIKNYILRINKKLNMKYDRDAYLDNYMSDIFNDSKIDNDINDFTNVLKAKCDMIRGLFNEIGNYVESDYYDELERVLSPLFNSKSYDEYRSNLNIDLPRLPKNSSEDAKKYKEEINNIIKELYSMCAWSDEDNIKNSIIHTKDYVDVFITIIKELDKKLKQYKYDNDLYEFTDIANLSIKLVKENAEIREELKNSFNEILVDEYQDTNDLQEGFISLISNNNVYMVGDIKQSIYRFRNANPNIFKQKYEQYKQNSNGIKIDLNKNFRSRGEVINSINVIFDSIMDNNFGGANYKLEHRLVLGNIFFDNEGKTNQNSDLEIYNYHFDKELGFKKEEIEIFLIANDIKQKIDNHYQVMDGQTGLRNVSYSDFSILLDRGNNFDLYKRIFTFMGIPLIVHRDESITSTSDILVIKSILKLISCIKSKQFDTDFKYAFMSVGRSFLCDYTDNDLFMFFINNTYKETTLYEKAYKISTLVDSLTIDAIFNMVIADFNVIESIIKIGDASSMIHRIEYLMEDAKTLSMMGYTLDMFIEYLDNSFNSTSDKKTPSSKEGGNACSIMTIHKSKGLEYNICYYAGLDAKFNIRDLTEMFYYDPTYGIIAPYFDEGISSTIYKILLREKYIKEEIEEKIRLFYVALTRCKEKMIIVCDMTSDESYGRDNDGLITLSSRLGYRSFRDIILSVKDELTSYIKNIEVDNIVDNEYRTKTITDYKKLIPISNIEITKNQINIESKKILETSYSRKINELLDRDTIESLNIGKTIHYYLEMLDFNNPDISNMNSFYQKKITSFLNQDILGCLNKSKIYKEYEFIYDDIDGVHHGIIDLMLEFDDHIKIIDYKLKGIDEEAYTKQLLGYKRYIESISEKRVELYLYSIMDEKYKKID